MGAGLIPKQFIADLLQRTNIVDVIGKRINLKKKGNEYVSCCPFHNEKTPSFTVSESKQFYYCFGCGEHGNAISFVMKFDNLSFVEAVESIAESIGLEVPRQKISPALIKKQKTLNSIYEANSASNVFFNNSLRASSVAIDYLKGRGISGETAHAFDIGFADEKWDSLLNRLGNNEVTLRSGLVVRSEKGKAYDRFRNRIMFPIRDYRGRVIGFGGRSIGDDSGAKYLNSPETDVFRKGEVLYGLYEAKKNNVSLSELIVVEGYMDVVGLHQYGVKNSVATLGTATTRNHLNILLKNVDSVVFCFDGDRAGRDAAWKAAKIALSMINDGKVIRFLFLAENEDPDSQVQKTGRDGFIQLIDEEGISLTDYVISYLKGKHGVSTMENRGAFAAEASELIKVMSDSFVREQFVDSVNRLSKVSKNSILKKSGANITPYVPNRINERVIKATPVRYAITLLLNHPVLASKVGFSDEIAMLNGVKGVKLLVYIMDMIEENPDVNASMILQEWVGTKYEKSIIMLMKYKIKSSDMSVLEKEMAQTMQQIKNKSRDFNLERLTALSAERELTISEKNDLLSLLKNK